MPAFPLAFVDTEHAEDTGETLSEDGEKVSSCALLVSCNSPVTLMKLLWSTTVPAWRVRFCASCLAPALSIALASRIPVAGNEVMKLDKKIRDFPVPLPAAPNAAMAESDSDVEKEQEDYARAMAEFMPIFYKHTSAFLLPCPIPTSTSTSKD